MGAHPLEFLPQDLSHDTGFTASAVDGRDGRAKMVSRFALNLLRFQRPMVNTRFLASTFKVLVLQLGEPFTPARDFARFQIVQLAGLFRSNPRW